MFIKLTGDEGDHTLLLRSDQICAISDQGGFTDIFSVGTSDWFRVKETPEQIMEMIELLLTRGAQNETKELPGS